MAEVNIVKSEQEIQKVVKAMCFLFLNQTYKAFGQQSPKKFMEGLKAVVTLKPGQETTADKLISCEIICDKPEEKMVPSTGQVTQTLKDFVLAVRKVFTSIHEYKKVLTYTLGQFPTDQDMEWVDYILASYSVVPTKQYFVLVPLPNTSVGAMCDIGFGSEALDNVQMFIKGDWFIPYQEGFESVASKEEDRDKLRPGLVFREL